MGIRTSKLSALSINVLLIFEMQERNGALFLKAHFLSYASLLGFVTVLFPFTTIYASLESHKSDLSIDKSYWFIWFVSIISIIRLVINFFPFLVINLGISLGVVPNKFVSFLVFHFYMMLKTTSIHQ